MNNIEQKALSVMTSTIKDAVNTMVNKETLKSKKKK